MHEFSAALGLLQLKHLDEALARRKAVDEEYRARLNNVQGISFLGDAGERVANYAYFPILVESTYHRTRDELYHWLKEHGIHPRRYFYPSLTTLPFLPASLRRSCPVSESLAQRVLALPLYPSLARQDVERIAACIRRALVA